MVNRARSPTTTHLTKPSNVDAIERPESNVRWFDEYYENGLMDVRSLEPAVVLITYHIVLQVFQCVIAIPFVLWLCM